MAWSLVRVRPAGSSSCSGGTIDMVYFESEMATSSDPSEGGTVWAVTMLVGANAANAQLGCADDPGFALIGLVPRRLRLAGSGWEGELEGLVASFVPCRASLILMLPRAEASSQHHVQRILRILNGARNLDWTVAIAVAEEPTEWVSVEGIHGFIKSSATSLPGDSAAAMALMSTFMSPTLLTLSDEVDVLAAVGDAEAPSVIAILSWNYESRELTFDSGRDRANVSKAKILSLSPLWEHGSWRDSHELMRQLRQHLAEGAEATYNTSTEHFRPSVASARRCPVVVLCKGEQLV